MPDCESDDKRLPHGVFLTTIKGDVEHAEPYVIGNLVMKNSLWIVQSLFIMAGGAAGAFCRFWFSEGVQLFFDRHFPVGILCVNVLGSFLMGLMSAAIFRFMPAGADHWRAFVLVGFLGAFTTFSTFSLDTVNLFQQAEFGLAFLNVALSVVLCVGAAFAGLYITTNVI